MKSCQLLENLSLNLVFVQQQSYKSQFGKKNLPKFVSLILN